MWHQVIGHLACHVAGCMKAARQQGCMGGRWERRCMEVQQEGKGKEGEKMRKKREKKKRERKEGRKERRRGIETNVAWGAELEDKGLGTALREVGFLLLRLFYA